MNNIGTGLGRVAFIFCVLLWVSDTAFAHDPGLSAADVRIGDALVVAHLSIACSDIRNVVALDADCDSILTESSLGSVRPRLEAFGRYAIELLIADRRVAPTSVKVGADQTGAIHFQISFDRPAGSQIRIRSATIRSFARGHREYVSVTDERGNTLGEKLLDAADNEFELGLNVPSGTRAGSFLPFLGPGIEHILTGYDHLVFLLGLLLFGAGFKDVAKIITSFTAAHSITLALSAFDLVRIPPAIVEPLIAVSIVYVGLENIFRRDLRFRWVLTFVFGLVHGFGFASALRGLGIGSGAGAALQLVSFNVGVEIGQLGIAVVVLPLIWKFRKRPVFVTRFAPVCSILISVAGGLWLIERILGQ